MAKCLVSVPGTLQFAFYFAKLTNNSVNRFTDPYDINLVSVKSKSWIKINNVLVYLNIVHYPMDKPYICLPGPCKQMLSGSQLQALEEALLKLPDPETLDVAHTLDKFQADVSTRLVVAICWGL